MSRNQLRVLIAAALCLIVFLGAKLMVAPQLAIGATAFVALVQGCYLAYSPKALPTTKPSWSWFPKYRFSCELAPLPEGTDARSWVCQRLGENGFTVLQETNKSIKLKRGYPKGDFAIELTQVNVTVSLPVNENADVLVEYGWVCLFDTGDLWSFSEELKRQLGQASSCT